MLLVVIVCYHISRLLKVKDKLMGLPEIEVLRSGTFDTLLESRDVRLAVGIQYLRVRLQLKN